MPLGRHCTQFEKLMAFGIVLIPKIPSCRLRQHNPVYPPATYRAVDTGAQPFSDDDRVANLCDRWSHNPCPKATTQYL